MITDERDVAEEVKRQGQDFFDTIMNSVNKTGKMVHCEDGTVYFNAIISALVSALAYYLAAVPDEDSRLEVFRDIGLHLFAEVEKARKNGNHSPMSVSEITLTKDPLQ